MAELEYLSEHLNALLASLSDAEKRKFAMMIARKIRAAKVNVLHVSKILMVAHIHREKIYVHVKAK
jgi:hypothetical protein